MVGDESQFHEEKNLVDWGVLVSENIHSETNVFLVGTDREGAIRMLERAIAELTRG